MQETIIKGQKRSGLFSKESLKELLHYKDLLFLLVYRDITVLYKQSVVGFGWAIIKPLFQMVVFTIFFGKMAGIEKQLPNDMPYVVFSYSGLLAWTYFSAALSNSTTSLVTNSNFLTKVYFPRIIIPLTPILSKLVDFLIAFVVMFMILIYYQIPLHWTILYIPFLLLFAAYCALGISLGLSALAIQYRDINQMMSFFIGILMYVTPVIWPLSYIPEKYQMYYALYPMVGVIESFRAAFMGLPIPWHLLLPGFLSSTVIFLIGNWFFQKREAYFADVA